MPTDEVPNNPAELAGEVHQHQFVITVMSFGRAPTAADVETTRKTVETFLRHAGFTAHVEASGGPGPSGQVE